MHRNDRLVRILVAVVLMGVAVIGCDNEDNDWKLYDPASGPDLAVTKTVSVGSGGTANVGDDISYTVTVRNEGPWDATGVDIIDELPDGVDFQDSDADQGTYDDDTGLWDVGNIASGSSVDLTLNVEVIGAIGTTVTNSAAVTNVEPADPNPGNNTASVPFDIGSRGLIARDDGPYVVQENATLNEAAPGILANDEDPDGLAITLDTTPVQDAVYGTLTISADGSFQYVHLGDEAPTDSFRYRITNTAGDADTATVTISITGDCDPPVLGNLVVPPIDEGQQFNPIDLDALVTDPDTPDEDITWTVQGDVELSYNIDQFRMLHIIIPDDDWNGTEDWTLTATDDCQPVGLWDSVDFTLEVRPANDGPEVVPGATAVTVSPVNRFGAGSTTIYADFTDVDGQAVSDFVVSFRVREPDGTTVLTLVDGQNHGSGGLTITDNGGGSYQAAYDWNPDDAQALGLYDLQFEVSDGIAPTVTDGYGNNPDELEVIESLTDNPPSVVAGATTATPATVNRYGNETTVLSAVFTDIDNHATGQFLITFAVREPDNSTEVTLVNGLTSGNGGLSVVFSGGDTYTARYTWDPGDSQTEGPYDLYFMVDDQTTTPAEDQYTDNEDELTVTAINQDPVVAAGACTANPATVNRVGASTTLMTAVFSDADDPGVGAFTASFRVRAQNNAVTDLVDAQQDGNGGLSITDLGGGSYRAEYTWDPDETQRLGDYDLQFEVSDGISSPVIDDYTNNPNELTVTEDLPNNPPTVGAGATQVDNTPVIRESGDTTTISTSFTDMDDPGAGAFTVTFKVREPDNSTEVLLVDGETDGSGGLTINDDGGGSYTAEYTWDPPANQAVGSYDLHFEVSDGEDSAVDGFANNENELAIAANSAPTVATSATQVDVTPVVRESGETTTISAVFADTDDPGEDAFTVTFKVREPDDSTEVVLVDGLANGSGGLTITPGAPGSYTAEYTWDPPNGQAVGDYDLSFEVSDGMAGAADGFADNADELAIAANNAPTVVAGATDASDTPVDVDTGSTTISTQFTDLDAPGIDAFTVTFKVRDSSDGETTLVSAVHNVDGLQITDNTGGVYTASFVWSPVSGDEETYDLQFEVDDGMAPVVTDGFDDNQDAVVVQ